jgi:hypothetical protein
MGSQLSFDVLGKLLLFTGVFLAVIGLFFLAGSRASLLGLGKLPGDLTYRSKNVTFYFPIASSLVVSVLLTLLMTLISWLMRR